MKAAVATTAVAVSALAEESVGSNLTRGGVPHRRCSENLGRWPAFKFYSSLTFGVDTRFHTH